MDVRLPVRFNVDGDPDANPEDRAEAKPMSVSGRMEWKVLVPAGQWRPRMDEDFKKSPEQWVVLR